MKSNSFFVPKNVSGYAKLMALVIVAMQWTSCCFKPVLEAKNSKCIPCQERERERQNLAMLTQEQVLSGPSLNAVPNEVPVKAEEALPVVAPQDRKEKKLPLGIRSIGTTLLAGPNMSFRSTEESFGGANFKKKPGLGFQVGVGSRIGFSKQFNVSPALLLKHNTAKTEYSYNNGSDQMESKTTYSYTWLSMPVHAEFLMGERFTLLAGPEVNVLLAAKAKDEQSSENMKKNSVGVGLGAQAGFRLGLSSKSDLALQVIYDHRISRLNKKEMEYGGGGYGYEAPANRMSSIQASLICDLCSLFNGGL